MANLIKNTNSVRDTMKAARAVIRREGIEGLDVRKIVKEAGYSIGTFYNNFKNLDDLVVCLNADTIGIFKKALLEDVDPEDTPQKIIEKLCSNYINFARKNKVEWLLLFEYHTDGPTPEHYKEKINQVFNDIYGLLHPFFGGSEKRVHNAVKVLWSSLHGICSLTLRDKLEGDPLELSLNMVHNYVTGYRVGLL